MKMERTRSMVAEKMELEWMSGVKL